MTPSPDPEPPSLGRAWYVVGVLTLIYVFSFIDRQILNLLVGPIRRDLGIGDTAMGLLIGFSFAIFYTFFGIPLGRLADRTSRRWMIALGFVSWSLFTAGCGVARNFAQMALMRMGVGIGEATLSPAAYSLIVDYFPPRLLSTATAIYSMGICIGSGLAFVFGGLVIEFAAQRPWQWVFFIVGLPGLVVALLCFTFPEPVRKGHTQHQDTAGAITYLRRNARAILGHNVGFGLHYATTYAASAWLPSYMLRVHGMKPGEFGIRYGLIVALCGSLGMLAGGWLADRQASRGSKDAVMRLSWWSILLAIPFGVTLYLAPDRNVALWLTVPTVFFALLPSGLAPTAVQQIMPANLRGQGMAVYLFVVNLIGLGLGPVVPGFLTEHYFQNDKLVHHSLIVVTIGAGLASILTLAWAVPAWRECRSRLPDPAGHAVGQGA